MKEHFDHKNPVCFSAVQLAGLLGILVACAVSFSCGKPEPELMQSGGISIPANSKSGHEYVALYQMFYKKRGANRSVTRRSPMLVYRSDMEPRPVLRLSPDGRWSVFRKGVHGPIPLPENGKVVIYHGNKPNFATITKFNWSEKDIRDADTVRRFVLRAISESERMKVGDAHESESQ